jgi:hypothetical protein
MTPHASARRTTWSTSIDTPGANRVATCRPAADGITLNHASNPRWMALAMRACRLAYSRAAFRMWFERVGGGRPIKINVRVIMQPGPSGRAAVTVLLDGKPIGDARGMDVGTDGVARFDRVMS